MTKIRTITDIDECQKIWKQLIPKELISDLWEVRYCFHENYNNQPRFVVEETDGVITGFLPLCWNEETNQYNYFPGETWEGKTWLEQNRIIASNRSSLNNMLQSLDGPYHLRYLRNEGFWAGPDERVDETGYLFVPEQYNFQIENYFNAFSNKNSKRLKKELASWENLNLTWRFNHFEDFEVLAEMNIKRYGENSYFNDSRFLTSFRSLIQYLCQNGWIRTVAILIDGEPAAIDMGSMYNGMLTLLAGGTNENFKGIAKVINMHHMTYACEQKLDSVDFLCGDFNWKTLFHLSPSPLYKLDAETPAVIKQHYYKNRSVINFQQIPDSYGALHV